MLYVRGKGDEFVWVMDFVVDGVRTHKSTGVKVGRVVRNKAGKLQGDKESERQAQEVENQARKVVDKSTGPTLFQAFQRYYQDVAKLNQSGGKAFKVVWERLMREGDPNRLNPNMPVADLTAKMIGDWRAHAGQSGKLVQKAGQDAGEKVASKQGLAPSTVNNYVGVLSAVLNHCAKETVGFIVRAPEVEPLEYAKVEKVPLKGDQFERLVAATNLPRAKRFFRMLAGTGARWDSEMMELRWDRVDLTRNFGAGITFGSAYAVTKGGKSRPINVGNALRDILVEMRDEQIKAGVYQPNGFVWMYQDPRDAQWKRWEDPTGAFKAAVRRSGIEADMLAEAKSHAKPGQEVKAPKVTLHVLRHTFANHLLKNGVLIQEVSKQLGHADIATTDRIYGHLKPIDCEASAAVMDDFLKAA